MKNQITFFFCKSEKEKEQKICCFITFYDINYLNSTKSRLSNKNLGIVPELTFIQKWTLSPNFKSLSLKMTKLDRGGGSSPPPQTWNKLAQRQRGIGLKSTIIILNILLAMMPKNSSSLIISGTGRNLPWFFRQQTFYNIISIGV